MRLIQFGQVLCFFFMICIIHSSGMDIRFLEEPKATEVHEGGEVVLTCIFSESANGCFWERNEIIVEVRVRYEYTSGNEHNTGDCSIKITNCNPKLDTAMWRCGATNGLMSQPVQLTVHSRGHAFLQEPSDVTVNARDNGRLDCVLRFSVTKCHWRRNGMGVLIDKRYKYLIGNGKNTTICSIGVANARAIDNGMWQCVINEYESRMIPLILSQEATFSVIPVSFVLEPRNMSVKDSDNFVLDCALSHTISECFWYLNGATVETGGRYKYVSGNGRNTSTCSIFIHNAQSTDNGNWQCACKADESGIGLASKEVALTVIIDERSNWEDKYSESVNSYIVPIMTAFTGSILTLLCQYVYFIWINTKNGALKNLSADFERKPLLSKEEEVNKSNVESKRQLDESLIRNPDVYRVKSGGVLPQKTLFWIVDNFRSKKRQAFERKDDFFSDSYEICSEGCHVQLRMHIETTHACLFLDKRSISLFFKFVPDDTGNISDHVFDHDISFIVQDLKTGDMAISQTKQPVFGKHRQNQWKTDWTGNRMFSTLALIVASDNYLDNDSLKVEVSIRDLNPLLNKAESYNGILNWKIDNYSVKRKQEEMGYFDKLVSPQFYTAERGYLMRALLFLNGSLRHGTHIEVQLRTYRGKYDALLPRAFAHVRKVTIMAYDDSFHPIVKTDIIDPSVIGEDEAEFQMGEPKKALLVPRVDVENNTYLWHDTLHIKVEIIPLNKEKFQTETVVQCSESGASSSRSLYDSYRTF